MAACWEDDKGVTVAESRVDAESLYLNLKDHVQALTKKTHMSHMVRINRFL